MPVLKDEQALSFLNRLRRNFGKEGVKLLLEEVGKRVSAVLKIQGVNDYPKATGKPLAKRYRWKDGKLHKFKSLRAQRGFFAALARGDINIPYRRTGKLAESITVTTQSKREGLVISVGIPKGSPAGKYAGWVVGNPQSRYFKSRSNWKPLEVMLLGKRQEKKILDAARDALASVFEDLTRA